MNAKYTLIILGLFFTTSMYLMISSRLEYFITQHKWLIRATSPFIMIYLIYIRD
jgi:hypothetical protein